MKKAAFLCVLCGVVVLLAQRSASAQIRLPDAQAPAPLHRVSGNVILDRKGSPGEALLITLMPADGAGRLELFADSSGQFEFKGVPAGSYVVTVRAPQDSGYEDGNQSVRVYAASNSTTYTVMVVLKPKKFVLGRTTRGGTVEAVDPDAAVPATAKKAYEKGVKAADAGKGDEALARFNEALAIAPDYRAALNDLGVQLLKLDRSKEAVEVLRHAVRLGPDAFAPRLNLALALFTTEDLEGAETEIAAALSLSPDSSRALCAGGQIALRRGNVPDAVTRLKHAVELADGMQAAAALSLGHAYEAAGDVASAVEAYRMVTYLEPASARAADAHTRLKALGGE